LIASFFDLRIIIENELKKRRVLRKIIEIRNFEKKNGEYLIELCSCLSTLRNNRITINT
jgi:hypothetical protein